MKQKIQLTLFVFLLIAINLIGYIAYFRIDLTQDKRYTLSDYTKQILDQLSGNIQVTIYLDGKNLPIEFKRFRLAIKEQLDEFKLYKGAKSFNYTFLNPTSEKLSKQERIKLYQELKSLDITPLTYQEVSQTEAKQLLIFPSAKLTYTYTKNDSIYQKEVGINLLNKDPNFNPTSEQNINNSIQTLEYKFVSSFLKLFDKKPKTVAFIEGHGELPEIFVIEFERALADFYEVRRGVIGGQYGILDSFDAIIIVKPLKRFSKQDKFVIDQYLMKGGKILWLLDGVNVDMDSIIYYDKAFAFPALMEEIGLQDMLFRYGVRVNSDIIQDYFSSTIRLVSKGSEQYQTFKWLYFPILVTPNNHVINKYVDYIHTVFISSIDTVGIRPGLSRKVLLTTSPLSRKINITFPYQITLDEVHYLPPKEAFNSGPQPVAVLLEGRFTSAFKGRIVDDMLPRGAEFIEKSVPTKMIVISDGDIARNEVTSDGRVMPLGFDRYSGLNFPGNKEFLINAVNYLCGDEGLMQLRGREFKLRVLNQQKVAENYLLWKVINILVPIFMAILLILLIKNWLKWRAE